jgi:hypothetical protein
MAPWHRIGSVVWLLLVAACWPLLGAAAPAKEMNIVLIPGTRACVSTCCRNPC